MIRTQVYLRGDQFQKIRLKARMEKRPEAELIRELVDQGFEAKYGAGERGLSTGDALLGLAKLGEELGLSGPTDLSPVLMTCFMGKTANEFIIADTSALISLVVPTDHNHKIAVKEAEKLRATQKEIIVINAVYMEFLNTLGKRFGHNVAIAASHRLIYPFVLLNELQDIPSSGALDKFAVVPQGVSFTDCMVMATADAYATKEIFGFDKQFADAGYTRLTPSTNW